MDKTDLKRLALARDIETAFKNHLGTDSFPTAEWPAVALAFAKVVMATDVNPDNNDDTGELTGHVQDLVRDMGQLTVALSDLVGL